MIITYEVLNEDTLPILEQLERLNLLRRMPEGGVKIEKNAPKNTPYDNTTAKEILKIMAQNQNEEPVKPAKKSAIPLRKKSLAGSLSPETAQKLREHIETVRSEWEHRI